MRGFRDRMFGDSFDTVEAYILRHGESRDSHGRHRRDFMRGFKGGMFGGGFRTGRKFDAADLQLIILALLSEQPRHGYELIKTLEERSGGFYVPSPGVIYPALTYLEETGLAEVEASGTKKLYRITESGQKRVEENRELVEVTLAKLAAIGERWRMSNGLLTARRLATMKAVTAHSTAMPAMFTALATFCTRRCARNIHGTRPKAHASRQSSNAPPPISSAVKRRRKTEILPLSCPLGSGSSARCGWRQRYARTEPWPRVDRHRASRHRRRPPPRWRRATGTARR